MTLATLADDVASVIAHFAPGPALLVGHAYGHWVARMTDLRHPDRVWGVVALGAAARVFPAGMAESLALASDPTQDEKARLHALAHCMFAPGNDPRPWLAGWYPQWRRAYRDASASPPRDSWYGQGHAPLLDLQGAQDPWRPPSTRQELVQILGKRVSVEVIANAGHALVPEQPQAIARAVTHWARGIGHA
jgi:pimeloyl-ACP methyl ester carboxylesterase